MKGRSREAGGRERIFYLLVHFSNGHKGQVQDRPISRIRDSILVSQKCVAGFPELGPSLAISGGLARS